MGRPRKSGIPRRVKLRIPEQWVGVFDRYTPDQLSDLMSQALANCSPEPVSKGAVTTVVRPEKPVAKTIARISANGCSVRVLFPEKLEAFRDVIKRQCLYRWDSPYWVKSFSKGIDYQVSLVAYNLLSAGFCVQSDVLGIAESVISGEFEMTGLRKISVSDRDPYSGWLLISWPRAGENYYDEAIAITAAKYRAGNIIVPPEHYEEVEDFAEQYDFSFAPDAMRAVEAARRSASVGFVPSKKTQQRLFASSADEIPQALIDED